MRKYFERAKDFILKWYNSLSGLGKIIVLCAGVLFLAFFTAALSKVKFNYNIIDYNKTTLEELISSSSESKDRLIFLKSEAIIDSLIDTVNGKYTIEKKKVKLDDFYDNCIYSDYLYVLSKSNFKKKVKSIASDFKKEYNVESPSDLKDYSIISDVYLYSDAYDMYIIKMILNENEHYVGLKYSSVQNTYSIFYIN